MADVLVYTAVFGRKDMLAKPKIVSGEVDYVYYTDLDLSSVDVSPYRVVRIDCLELKGLTNPLKNRRVKIYWPSIFDGYDYSIYMDSRVQLLMDPLKVLDKLEESDLFVLKLCHRRSIYEVAEVLRNRHLCSGEVIDRQVARYRKEGYLANNGVYQGGFIVRRHTQQVQEFSKAWWEEVRNFCYRDQLSLPYVLWRTGIRFTTRPSWINDMVYAHSHRDVK